MTGKGKTAKERSRVSPGYIARAAAALLVLFLCAVIYFSGVLMDRDEESSPLEAEAAEAAPASLKPGLYESVAALRTAVDFPLIALDEGCVVQADNVDWQGISARLVTLRFTSGIEITAAAPAEAAPLLKRGGMTLAGNTDLKVVTMDASLAMGPGGACLYFSSGQAAYCLYGPGMTGEQVLHVGLGLTSRNVY